MEEVKALLAIWGDSKIQEELDGAVRNQVVFQHIAKQLKEQRIQRDWKQCHAKVKNLKTKYREVKSFLRYMIVQLCMWDTELHMYDLTHPQVCHR